MEAGGARLFSEEREKRSPRPRPPRSLGRYVLPHSSVIMLFGKSETMAFPDPLQRADRDLGLGQPFTLLCAIRIRFRPVRITPPKLFGHRYRSRLSPALFPVLPLV